MTTVGIRELKTNTSEIVRRVRERGEIVDITHRGEVVARLIPAHPVVTSAEELAELWAEMDRLAEEVSAHWTGAPNAVEAVREARREL
jgi:prevent-host-death family protein